MPTRPASPGGSSSAGSRTCPGATMFDKMTWLQANRDDIRLRMLREPRGYPAANCNLILPSNHPDADAGYVIMEQVEYPGMSGTNTMCVVTVLLETGMLPMREPVTELTLEAPAGLIRVSAACRDGKVTGVTFRNVPAFATHIGRAVEVPHLGTVVVDVAYGGMFYVIADAERFGLRLTPDEGADIVRITEMIKAAANEQLPVVHPEQPGFAGITIGQLSGPAARPGEQPAERRDRLDRDARLGPAGDLDRRDRPLAVRDGHVARRWRRCTRRASSRVGETFRHEGILGTVFTGRWSRRPRSGPYRAVVPTITGQAWITGFASYVVDPTDPFPDGFTVGDIWAVDAQGRTDERRSRPVAASRRRRSDRRSTPRPAAVPALA